MNVFFCTCFLVLLVSVWPWLLSVPVMKFKSIATQNLPQLGPRRSAVRPRHRLTTGLKLSEQVMESDEPSRSDVIDDEPDRYAGMSMIEQIQDIVNQVLAFSKDHKDLSGLDPTILLNSAHIITHGKLYENVMNDRIHGAQGREERAELEKVDALIRGFVTAERKQRNRLKILYIIAGAQSGEIDNCVKLLSDSENIDDDLIKYLDGLIQQQQVKLAGPGGGHHDKSMEGQEDEPKTLLGDGIRASLSVLRMVHKLLRAEMNKVNKVETRLLSVLLNEKDPEARYTKMTAALTKIELVENFATFLRDGIDYLRKRDMQSEAERIKLLGNEYKNDIHVKLPAGVVEQMKDILLDVQAIQRRLETGSSGGHLYSTDQSDFADKGPLADEFNTL